MKVILQQEVISLGSVGDVVSVKAGYARNFLFPRKIATIADAMGIKQLELFKEKLKAQTKKLVQQSQELASKIEETSITINKQIGEEDRIYGTVTAQEIVDLLKEEGLEISKKQIFIDEEIKKIGVYHAMIKLPQNVDAKLKFWVVAK